MSLGSQCKLLQLLVFYFNIYNREWSFRYWEYHWETVITAQQIRRFEWAGWSLKSRMLFSKFLRIIGQTIFWIEELSIARRFANGGDPESEFSSYRDTSWHSALGCFGDSGCSINTKLRWKFRQLQSKLFECYISDRQL